MYIAPDAGIYINASGDNVSLKSGNRGRTWAKELVSNAAKAQRCKQRRHPPIYIVCYIRLCVCVLTKRRGVYTWCICARPSAPGRWKEKRENGVLEACERALAYVFYYVFFDRLALL